MKFVILFIVFLLIGCGKDTLEVDIEKNDVENIEVIKETKVSMITAGDVLIHGTVYKDALVSGDTYDFTKMFTSIKEMVKDYDLKFYNQETIIGGKELGLSTYPRFNSPEEIVDAMLDMGFNMVSLANNHTLDKGTKGVLNSIDYWSEKDALTSGSYKSIEDRNSINIKEKNGIKYTLLSYTTTTNGLVPKYDYLVNVYDEEKVKEDIERIKPYTDVIMVSMHWGEEYNSNPSSRQKQIAKYLSSLGVNVIIGTHPHVIQPIEFIDDTLVIYSLGNFISAQIGIDRLVGMMVSYDIVKDKDIIRIENVKADLIYTYYKNFKNYYVYPFYLLDDDILPNYIDYYDKYSKIIKKYDVDNKIIVNSYLTEN